MSNHLRNLEAVFFDLDDTLVQTTYFNDQSLNVIIKVLNDRHSRLGLSRDEVQKIALNIKIRYGTSYGKLFDEFKTALAIEDEKILTELTIAFDRLRPSLRLFPGVASLLKQLIQNHLKVCVVTQGVAFRQWKKMLVLGIADLLDGVVVGVSKPNPRIFEVALNIVDSDRSRSAFIGDRPDLDIKGAKQTGMIAIRVLQGRAAGQRAADETERADFEIRAVQQLRQILEIVLEHGERNMGVILPTKNEDERVEILSKVLGDQVSKAIIQFLAKAGYGYLSHFSRDLAEKKIASRKSVYEHLVGLETAGILESTMTRIKSDNEIKTWVKRYTISEQHKDLMSRLLE